MIWKKIQTSTWTISAFQDRGSNSSWGRRCVSEGGRNPSRRHIVWKLVSLNPTDWADLFFAFYLKIFVFHGTDEAAGSVNWICWYFQLAIRSKLSFRDGWLVTADSYKFCWSERFCSIEAANYNYRHVTSFRFNYKRECLSQRPTYLLEPTLLWTQIMFLVVKVSRKGMPIKRMPGVRGGGGDKCIYPLGRKIQLGQILPFLAWFLPSSITIFTNNIIVIRL